MRDVVTSLLELTGLLLLAIAVTLAGWRISPEAGLCAGGLALVSASALLNSPPTGWNWARLRALVRWKRAGK